MKNQTILTIILLLSQIFIHGFAANICMANDGDKGGFLSGSAWMDHNANSIQDLGEETMADVIVFVKNEATGKLITAKTNASGYYTVAELPYGRYTIWSESITGATTTAQLIELDEVNGATVVNTAFMPSATTQPAMVIRVYLPIITS